jgi:16S rRNA G966 N2-methylase RsmD
MSSRRKTEFFINYTKLFPEPPDRDYGKLQIDRETVSYITTPHNSKLISQIITNNINDTDNITIFDMMAGVGGDSIEFAKKYGRVISCEKDENRFSMLKNNISVYGFSNVDLHNSNCIDLLSDNKILNVIDVVYMDPPWGGKSYKNSDSLVLKVDENPI